jgi:hypothetical protein
LLAESQARIAYLANEIGSARDELDYLVLAKPDFTQPILKFRAGAELFDSNCHAFLHEV